MKNTQLPSLTSLRFFAALMVFFSHMGFIRQNPLTENFYNTWFFEGYSGVTFFLSCLDLFLRTLIKIEL